MLPGIKPKSHGAIDEFVLLPEGLGYRSIDLVEVFWYPSFNGNNGITTFHGSTRMLKKCMVPTPLSKFVLANEESASGLNDGNVDEAVVATPDLVDPVGIHEFG